MDLLTQLLARMAAYFPRDNVPESTVVLYAVELRSLDINILEGVIENSIKNCNHFPTISELRADYATAHRRHFDATRKPMIDAGATPMPEHIKSQWRETLRKMDERSEELEPS